VAIQDTGNHLTEQLQILARLAKNRQLLRADEIHTMNLFREHINDLEQRHIGESGRPAGMRFPEAINTLAAD
jgi:hypothetical protein